MAGLRQVDLGLLLRCRRGHRGVLGGTEQDAHLGIRFGHLSSCRGADHGQHLSCIRLLASAGRHHFGDVLPWQYNSTTNKA